MTLRAWRPLLLLVLAAGIAWMGGSGRPATSSLLEYQSRALMVVLALAAAGAWWWSHRHGREWGFEVVPAAAGAMAGLALVGALAGTPFAPGGLSGDQTFRTAAVTRFADSWRTADFTIEGLPSFYPPAYFWVLGRFAAFTGVEPWLMLKVGAIGAAVVVPMVAFVLWRRIVPARVAAVLAVVPLVVENFYEPYAWLVLAAFVPWWLEVVPGIGRDARTRDVVVLGLVGALLLMTYYYFFFVGALAAVVHLVAERVTSSNVDWTQIRRSGAVLALAASASAVFWLPLLVSMARAEHTETLSNRWFSAHHSLLPLPMLETSIPGVVMLVGLVYVLWSAGRDPLSRGLLVILTAAYCWYLVGALAALADYPLLSFRAKPMIPMVLLSAGVLAVVRLAEEAAARFDRRDVGRVTFVLAAVLGTFVGHGFIDAVRESSVIETAHSAPRPEQSPPTPSADDLQKMIEERIGAHATLVSDRIDVLVYFPNHGFVTWSAHYAHPAAEFAQRTAFLHQLATIREPSRFSENATNNRFGRIDGFVLLDEGDALVFRYSDDAFPAGTRRAQVRFQRSQFDDFEATPAGAHVLLTPRGVP